MHNIQAFQMSQAAAKTLGFSNLLTFKHIFSGPFRGRFCSQSNSRVNEPPWRKSQPRVHFRLLNPSFWSNCCTKNHTDLNVKTICSKTLCENEHVYHKCESLHITVSMSIFHLENDYLAMASCSTSSSGKPSTAGCTGTLIK